MLDENDIHQCYRCGGKAHFHSHYDGHGYVICYDCGLRTQMADNREKAIKLWNPGDRTEDD